MVKQLLLIAGLAVGLGVSAQTKLAGVQRNFSSDQNSVKISRADFPVLKASMNDGSNQSSIRKASNTSISWKRPAGQFWGTGYSFEENQLGYYYTPLVLRPYLDYTFENQSSVTKGTPSWTVTYWDGTGYAEEKVQEENLTRSYVWGEMGSAPLLSIGKGGTPYPSQYYKDQKTDMAVLPLCVNKDIKSGWSVGGQPVSSHYYSLFTRNTVKENGQYRSGIGAFVGAQGYPDGELDDEGKPYGYWFGTNAQGINAMATRFEKPLRPYLLNSVCFYYQFQGNIVNEMPLKAYVFKTANDAAIQTITTSTGQELDIETLEVGELIAVSENIIPKGTGTDEDYENCVVFEFKKVNPVTGAQTAYSLEIEDDITVIVTGYNANPGPEAYLTSLMSFDEFDEGYGNLGFLGTIEEGEDGTITYGLTAIKDFFSSPMPNTTLGVLADVTYPWVMNAYVNPQNDIKLANEGETTETEQGLEYILPLLSTSESSEFEVTYNGEDECDWLSITDVEDEYETNDEGEEEFTGEVYLLFEAAPNPDDVKRTCVVKLSIPAASYEITFRQGTGNDPVSVEVVEAEGNAQYFDLAGRRVMNPEKGLYIKVNGNKAEKVIR